ncbi:MAG: hypothetical protein AB1571_02115 [Nanoarchaeota archaeon]
MSLFGKKKEEKLELPKFPEFPSYTPTIKPLEEIKAEVQKQDIPFRQKTMPITTPKQQVVQQAIHEEKPIFVKIDKYKTAIHLIDSIKAKVKEAEDTLDELMRIKDEEERNLRAWKDEIEKIKNKLLDIDKNLFEV